MSKLRYVVVLFAISQLLTMGCQAKSKDQPDLGRVSGKIKLDGEPLTNAIIYMIPSEGRSSVGNTDKNGDYVMGYLPGIMGVKLGKDKVIIKTFWSDESSPEALAAIERIPAKYNSETELFADVKPGKNVINFDLTTKGTDGANQQMTSKQE